MKKTHTEVNKQYLNTLNKSKLILMKISNNQTNSQEIKNLARKALSVTRQSISTSIN